MEITATREREKGLRRTIAELENAEANNGDEQPKRKRKRGRKENDSDDELEKHRVNVNHLAHKCVILYSFWLRKGRATFTMDVDPDYVEVGQFETSETKAQGQ